MSSVRARHGHLCMCVHVCTFICMRSHTSPYPQILSLSFAVTPPSKRYSSLAGTDRKTSWVKEKGFTRNDLGPLNKELEPFGLSRDSTWQYPSLLT